MNKAISRVLLIIEFVLAIIFASLLADTFLTYREIGSFPNANLMVIMIAIAVAIAFPLMTNLLIRIKHRSNTPEGELLPFLLLSIILECTSYFPIYYVHTGNLILDPVVLNVLIRFCFLSSSLLFLFVALILIGATNKNYLSYIFTALIASLVLSIIAPSSSAIKAAGSNFGSDYDIYFTFAIALNTIATIMTFVGAATRDKMRNSIQRSISYILLVAGNYGIFIASNTVVTAIGAVLFAAGSIMLTITSKESF